MSAEEVIEAMATALYRDRRPGVYMGRANTPNAKDRRIATLLYGTAVSMGLVPRETHERAMEYATEQRQTQIEQAVTVLFAKDAEIATLTQQVEQVETERDEALDRVEGMIILADELAAEVRGAREQVGYLDEGKP